MKCRDCNVKLEPDKAKIYVGEATGHKYIYCEKCDAQRRKEFWIETAVSFGTVFVILLIILLCCVMGGCR